MGITNPSGKYYPKRLTPWEGFPLKLKDEFSKVHKILHPPKQSALRFFGSIPSIEEQGRLHCDAPIANEASLRIIDKVTVEVQVADIINN